MMSISSQEFRNALRHFPSGVTIVTLKTGERIHGLTVSAFTSVSPEPPLIAIVIDQRHRAYRILEEEGTCFAVNILHQDQASLAERFAWVKDEDRFAEGTWTTAVTGAPILADALVWLDCTIFSRHQAGTHTIYVGEVQASHVLRSDEPPLIYWNRSYRRLAKKSIKKPAPRSR
jgi:flavin reductase (DIM6/NTAB) family NADH-FMN oxidoreductase RutF